MFFKYEKQGKTAKKTKIEKKIMKNKKNENEKMKWVEMK